jgi:preprotein translocase subunit SecG
MSISYNSLTGIEGNPVTYISELAIKGRDKLDSSSATTRIVILLAFVVVTILYYVLFASLGKGNGGGGGSVGDSPGVGSSGSGEAPGKRTLEVILWSIFIILLIINGFQYFFNVNFTASIRDIFTDKPKIDLTVQKPPGESVVPQLKIKKEVFNIPSNNYTFDDSKAICQAYGGKLASYNQVEEAYNKGAEWCNYGWSDGQMVLFPTQQKTWDKLQGIEGHENDCGRPGINGGKIGNPNARFGVNCYGFKPIITPAEQNNMNNTPIHPISMRDMELQKKLEYWKKRVPEILLSPFNKNSWSILG